MHTQVHGQGAWGKGCAMQCVGLLCRGYKAHMHTYTHKATANKWRWNGGGCNSKGARGQGRKGARGQDVTRKEKAWLHTSLAVVVLGVSVVRQCVGLLCHGYKAHMHTYTHQATSTDYMY